MSKFLSITLGLFLLTVVPFAGTVKAQSSTATLRGTVVDRQKAIVSGATVTITDSEKAFERTAMTNGDGYFILTQLAPSRYTIKVSQSGFAETQISTVVLNVNDQSNLRIQLKVATASATVEVTGEASLINDSPAVSTVVDRQFIENQPLNGRSFQTLVELSPGVVFTASRLPTPGQFSVNGQRAGSNYFTVDGVNANFGSTASVTLYETAAYLRIRHWEQRAVWTDQREFRAFVTDARLGTRRACFGLSNRRTALVPAFGKVKILR